MRFARLILASVVCVVPQQAINSSPDAQLHTDVLKLVDLDGTKERLQNNLSRMIDEGKARMMQQGSPCNSAFADEWARRMLARASVDDFVNVVVAAFERHFSDPEIRELIALRNSKGTPQSSSISPALKQKLEKVMPSVQAEIMGGCVEVGAKLGGEIGQEIQKEHPEYCKEPAPAAK